MQLTRRGIVCALFFAPAMMKGLTQGENTIEIPDNFVLHIRHKDKCISLTADEIMVALQPIKIEPVDPVLGRDPSRSVPLADVVSNVVSR
jgi:hypothetical protein